MRVIMDSLELGGTQKTQRVKHEVFHKQQTQTIDIDYIM